MTTVAALREMMVDVLHTIRAEYPGYPHYDGLQKLLSDTGDDSLLAEIRTKLIPHQAAVTSRDANALSAAFPDYDITSIVSNISSEATSKIWQHLSMMCMLTTTISLVPPQMLEQIEGFARTMAEGMQGGNMGAFGDMFGQMMGAPTNAPLHGNNNANAQRRSKRRNNNKGKPQTAQQSFRDKLV